MKSCYRVVYYKGGSQITAFVVAETDTEASTFIGVVDGSASVTRVASPVEVSGLDPAHAALPSMPVNVAPFELPRSVSRAEFEALAQQIAVLQQQLAGGGKPVTAEK